MESILTLLKNIYFFNALSNPELKLLLDVSETVYVNPGDIIIKEHASGDTFFIVVDGAVEIWKDVGHDSADKLVTLYTGNFFGELALIDDLPRSATAIAKNRAKLLSIRRKDFKTLIGAHVSIALAVMKSMSLMIRESTNHYAGHLRIKDQHLIKEMTDRKKSEEALIQSEKLFKQLAENVTDIMWVIHSKHLNFTYVSPSAEKILGFTPEEMTTLFLQDVLTPESVEIALKNFQKDADPDPTSPASHVIELEAYRADGTTVWLEASSQFLKIDNKQPDSLIGVARDITKRKLIERELEKSRTLFSAAVEQSSAGVIIVDETGLNIKVANEAAEKLLNMDKIQLQQTPLDQLTNFRLYFPDKTPFTLKDLPPVRASAGEVITNEEMLIKKADGDYRWVLTNATPLKSKDGTIFGSVSVFPDITAIKTMEKKNQEFETKLQQARKMQSVSTLAGGVAHEFNNALFGITGNIDLLDMHLEAEGNIRRYIRSIKASTSTMTELTKQLLAYSRGGKYQPKTIYLSSIVEKVLLKFDSVAADNNIVLNTRIYPDESPVEADITQLQMVTKAILKNAVEAISSLGMIRINIKKLTASDYFARRFKGLSPGTYSCLTIRDNGCGMSPKTLGNIFEPFFTTNLPGRGLGMAAVYGIVKNHNGWIGVHSDPDKGTTVKIYLPVQAPVKSKQPVNGNAGTGSYLILLIEDEAAAMAVNREMIEFLGHSAVEAKTGSEAIKMVEQYKDDLDLVILDYDLPDMKGDKVYSYIKEILPGITILFSTGYDINDIAEEMRLDKKFFIQKPYSLSKLSSALKIPL